MSVPRCRTCKQPLAPGTNALATATPRDPAHRDDLRRCPNCSGSNLQLADPSDADSGWTECTHPGCNNGWIPRDAPTQPPSQAAPPPPAIAKQRRHLQALTPTPQETP